MSVRTFKETYLQVVLCKLFRQFFHNLKNVFGSEANGILDETSFENLFEKHVI